MGKLIYIANHRHQECKHCGKRVLLEEHTTCEVFCRNCYDIQLRDLFAWYREDLESRN